MLATSSATKFPGIHDIGRCYEMQLPIANLSFRTELLWEEYSWDGFTGESITVTNFRDMPKDMIAALNRTCPQCGQTGEVKYS
jgi:hypothetical protein